MTADSHSPEESLLLALAAELDELEFAYETSLSGASRHLLSTTGRNWRGRLLLAAARQGSDPESPNVIGAACAIELLQIATLAHDDLIDAGSTRRGVPTVGVVFGLRAAGFAGAKIYARAVELITECGDEAIEQFCEASMRMCEGGMLEFRSLDDAVRTQDQYFAAAGGKTAAAFELAAGLGAEVATSSGADVASLRQVGWNFGLAYQIWDDLTDLLASTEQSGKSPFSDLRQGLYTLPVIYALEESEPLRSLVQNGVVWERDQADVVDLIAATSGIKRAVRKADELVAEALAASRALPCPTVVIDYVNEARSRHEAVLR